MIVSKSNRVNHLDALSRMPDVFYLTGSRFFGTETPNSDWDFFVQHQDAVETRLKGMGFVTENLAIYESFGLVTILRHNLSDIHIQIVTNAHERQRVQESIRKHLTVPQIKNLFVTKSQAKGIWSAMLEMIRF